MSDNHPIIFKPGITPTTVSHEMQVYLNSTFQQISYCIQMLAAGHLDVTYKAPAKPRDGMIRFADGTSWNPGGGRGVYVYVSGTWTKMS